MAWWSGLDQSQLAESADLVEKRFAVDSACVVPTTSPDSASADGRGPCVRLNPGEVFVCELARHDERCHGLSLPDQRQRRTCRPCGTKRIGG